MFIRFFNISAFLLSLYLPAVSVGSSRESIQGINYELWEMEIHEGQPDGGRIFRFGVLSGVPSEFLDIDAKRFGQIIEKQDRKYQRPTDGESGLSWAKEVDVNNFWGGGKNFQGLTPDRGVGYRTRKIKSCAIDAWRENDYRKETTLGGGILPSIAEKKIAIPRLKYNRPPCAEKSDEVRDAGEVNLSTAATEKLKAFNEAKAKEAEAKNAAFEQHHGAPQRRAEQFKKEFEAMAIQLKWAPEPGKNYSKETKEFCPKNAGLMRALEIKKIEFFPSLTSKGNFNHRMTFEDGTSVEKQFNFHNARAMWIKEATATANPCTLEVKRNPERQPTPHVLSEMEDRITLYLTKKSHLKAKAEHPDYKMPNYE